MLRINFDLQQLHAFVAAAERGSFRAAAEQIHLSPPALSRRIDSLETALGARLFHRTTREIRLTSLGRVFLDRARAALDDLESAMLSVSEIAASRSGLVTVGCVSSAAAYFLPAVVRAFSERYPGIRLRVIDEPANQVLAGVISGEADFGISFMRTRVPEIDFEQVHVDPFVLAVRRDHKLARRKSVDWADLSGEPMIAVARSSGNRQLLDDALARAGLNPSFAVEVSHISTLLGMVEAGLGVAAVPRMALPPGHPSVMSITLRAPATSRTLGLITRHGAALRPAAAIFHGHLRTALRARRQVATKQNGTAP